MKKYFTLLILFILFTINAFSQTTYTPKDIAGKYTSSDGFVGASYTLTDDGKYEYEFFSDNCCNSNLNEIGTYEIKETKIYFKIIKEKDIKNEKIKTEHEMQIIKWGERFYLLESYNLHNFAAAVNLGVEPRGTIINEVFLTSDFYLRRGDENKTVSGKPNLPNEWLSLILNSPIKVSITKVKGEKREKKYTVNKGSAEGLKVGMCFVGKNTEIDYKNLVWVTSVEKHSAKLEERSVSYPPDYKVGDILTTKSYKSSK